MIAPKPVEGCLQVVDVPARGPSRARAEWRDKGELVCAGRLIEAGFGNIRNGIDRKAGDSVDHPDRLEDASGNRGLDARDGLGGARGRLDRRKPAHGPLDDRVVRPLGEIGRLLDHVEYQVDESPYASHTGRSMNRLRDGTQSAPLQP